MDSPHRMPIQHFYAAGALGCALIAATLPVYFSWILLWGALSLAAVSLAYYLELPHIFRKRADGSIPWTIRWLFIPFLFGAQLYNSVARRRDSVPALQEIEPGLFLACRLFPSDVPQLHKLNVGAVLDVTAEFDALDWSLLDTPINYLNVPVLDHQAPGVAKMHRAINWVDHQRRQGKGVVIHCALGRGRSVLMMAAYLLARHPKRSVDEVLTQINAIRQTARLNKRQYKRLAEAHHQGLLRLQISAWLIANPVSGGGKFAQYRADIETTLSPYFDLQICTTSKEQGADYYARQALQQGAKLLIACGGDGTVSEVADTLVREQSDAILGIIPLGTTNALSHALMGLDAKLLPVASACQHIIDGHARSMDVAWCNEKLAMLVIGVGFEQRMIELADRERKNQLGQFAYLSGLWQAIDQNRHLTLQVQFDDEAPSDIETASLTVANSAPFTTLLAQGNGEPQWDDGLLDVTWLANDPDGEERLISLAELALAATSSIKLGVNVQHRLAKRLRISAGHPLDYVIDGETYQADSLDITIQPGALKVCTAIPAHLKD
ncbi:diacylglycerol kinase family protein [Bowmanella sp. JS7-9]|uniref:Diacylglycerol kinase family protein n=1 Tax=Pseudobowmanella zhangzhouensis TaxID=1537679 RepID=A0ABW1XFS6_9ALTE|nr:diacylglycerol kinase family protein [Bowmanella sp. JS7-9]